MSVPEPVVITSLPDPPTRLSSPGVPSVEIVDDPVEVSKSYNPILLATVSTRARISDVLVTDIIVISLPM